MIGGLVLLLLPFAAGNFIYISLTDLMPELHKERRTRRTLLQFVLLLLGIGLMALLILFE
jgi:zinc and cadmium transporter